MDIKIIGFREYGGFRSRQNAYIEVDIEANNKSYRVSCVVGFREHGYHRDADAWWSDSTDWNELTNSDLAERVLTVLDIEAPVLWEEAKRRRDNPSSKNQDVE